MWDVCGLTVPPPGAESAAQPQRRRRRRRSSAAAQADLADELAAADADAAADKPIFDDFTSEFGPSDYLTTALLRHFKLMPSTNAYTVKQWALAVLESTGLQTVNDTHVVTLLKVSGAGICSQIACTAL